MKKREASFQTVFGNYIKVKGLIGNFELKQTTEDYLNFNDKRLIRQCESLLSASAYGYFWKHSDSDQREKPFDCSNIPPLPGFIVIKYPKFFCIIYVEKFMLEKQNSKRESLTSQRAMELALYTVYN